MTSKPLVVSSPGKVLITGGYLILDHRHYGCVLTTDSRFYCALQEEYLPDYQTQSNDWMIHVHAPQFKDTRYAFQLHIHENEWTVTAY
jgi:phosphomevalonate kinase